MSDNPVVLWILTVIWIPTVLSTVYVWSVYLPLRSQLGPAGWMLQVFSLTGIPLSIVMTYVSWATFGRINGFAPSSEFAANAGLLLVFLLGAIMPFKAIRTWQAIHGRVPQPEVPIVTNGKGEAHGG